MQIMCFPRGKWHSHREKAYKCMLKDMSLLVAVHMAAAAVVKGTSSPREMPATSQGCWAPFTWSSAIKDADHFF